jgi:hypothetical protein
LTGRRNPFSTCLHASGLSALWQHSVYVEQEIEEARRSEHPSDTGAGRIGRHIRKLE